MKYSSKQSEEKESVKAKYFQFTQKDDWAQMHDNATYIYISTYILFTV